MKYLKIISFFLVLFLAASCSSSKKPRSSSPEDNLLEVLTDFSIALNANDFQKALGYLIENEKNELSQPDGSISKETQMQLKALSLHKLIKNPRIKLVQGKLTGIVVALPKLEHIKKGSAGSDEPSEEAPPEPLQPEATEPAESPEGESPSEEAAPAGEESPGEGAAPPAEEESAAEEQAPETVEE